ncbi:MAG: hypothetical protein AB9869_33195 [Verrucomicrobiia bacterium]
MKLTPIRCHDEETSIEMSPTMTFIQLYANGQVDIPNGDQYLLVISEELDGEGNWVPSRVETVRDNSALRQRLKEIRNTGDRFVIRASWGFQKYADELGLPLVWGEWGLL